MYKKYVFFILLKFWEVILCSAHIHLYKVARLHKVSTPHTDGRLVHSQEANKFQKLRWKGIFKKDFFFKAMQSERRRRMQEECLIKSRNSQRNSGKQTQNFGRQTGYTKLPVGCAQNVFYSLPLFAPHVIFVPLMVIPNDRKKAVIPSEPKRHLNSPFKLKNCQKAEPFKK